jgi:hypothetical protein
MRTRLIRSGHRTTVWVDLLPIRGIGATQTAVIKDHCTPHVNRSPKLRPESAFFPFVIKHSGHARNPALALKTVSAMFVEEYFLSGNPVLRLWPSGLGKRCACSGATHCSCATFRRARREEHPVQWKVHWGITTRPLPNSVYPCAAQCAHAVGDGPSSAGLREAALPREDP